MSAQEAIAALTTLPVWITRRMAKLPSSSRVASRTTPSSSFSVENCEDSLSLCTLAKMSIDQPNYASYLRELDVRAATPHTKE
jgi:hypothetical protein